MEITNSTTPLTSSNIINVYFSSIPIKGNLYISGIFSNQSPQDFPNFLSKVSEATFVYFIRDDDNGTVLRNGYFYKKLKDDTLSISLGSTYINDQQKIILIASNKAYNASLLLNCESNDGENGLKDSSINHISPINTSIVENISSPIGVTFQSISNNIDFWIYLPNHGLQNGDRIRFNTSGTLPLCLKTNKDYYVINFDSYSSYYNQYFRVSSSSSLTPLVGISGTGTGEHSIVTITPSVPPSVPSLPITNSSIKKYGFSSLFFNSSSLVYPASIMNFLYQNKTVEFWLYVISPGEIISGDNAYGYPTNGPWSLSVSTISNEKRNMFNLDASTTLEFILNNPSDPNAMPPYPIITMAPLTWTHLAICNRQLFAQPTLDIYKNGIKITSIKHTGLDSLNNIIIGQNFHGYIDDFRVFDNVNLYQRDFTPPTTQLSNTGTIIL